MPVKINIINFQNINNKKANLLHLMDTDKPDVIAGSEMCLNSTIFSSLNYSHQTMLFDPDRSCGGPGMEHFQH